MKKIAAILLATCLSAMLCGCDLWMDGSYVSVKPHQGQGAGTQHETAEISDYAQLLEILTELVESGTQNSVIYTSDLNESLLQVYMQNAVDYVKTSTPIGAYALNEITYDIGTNAGRPAVALEVLYEHGRSEILRIKDAATMDEAAELLEASLDHCDTLLVLRVAAYEETDFTHLVQTYVNENPQNCMEMPQVVGTVYPESGQDRVVELSFSYQTDRDSLRNMQQQVKPVFESAELYVNGDADPRQKYMQLYAFLTERYNYTLETSITPSYSLLCHGVGDSKAFATVYAAMCRNAELECTVVSGTKSGEPRFWNMVCIDGTYYHVDLLQNDRGFRLRTDGQMSGYVWDYSAYPTTG